MTTFVVTVDNQDAYVTTAESDAVDVATDRAGTGLVTILAYRHHNEPSHRQQIGHRWWTPDGTDVDGWFLYRQPGEFVRGAASFEEVGT